MSNGLKVKVSSNIKLVVENHSNNNIVKMLVANKSDEENGRKVSIEEG